MAVRFIVVWVVTALSLIVTSWLMPGITLGATEDWPVWAVALGASFILGLVNLLIRPLVLLLAIPLGFIVVFIVGFFVNSFMLLITANLMPDGLHVDGWLSAFVGGIIMSTVISLLNMILGAEDLGSFYDGVIARRLIRYRADSADVQTAGLVMLEIDGLSYYHIQKAIRDGYMPNVEAMIRRQGYVLSHADCGLPSQTSSCQAGILFGDNYDIPAFRWYDKAQQRHYVSGNHAAEINARYAKGHGLLRDGASINNMMNGDAPLSLLTAADLRGGTDEQKRARARDVYLLLLNPNFFMRVIGLFLGEAVIEVWQYVRDVARDRQPRLNRLHKFYPFVRATTTVFMREVSGLLTIMQIVRGEPAIYMTWPGYDEVAHHSGPWSKYAFGTLRGYDRFIGVVQEIIATRASRPYELILLSDHGQSFGPTFKMRYGYSLKDYIQGLMPEGTVMVETAGKDDGSLSVTSTVAELGNIQTQQIGGRIGQATVKQLRKAAERGVQEAELVEALEGDAAADVTFCGSGNLAQVYFHAFGHRASLAEVDAAFPGMVEAVIAHEGVGIVVVVDGEGTPIVFGQGGARNLHTGETSGEDPLLPYGDVELRAWQLARLADFPSAGDLIIISTVYPDGTVAAMEELIGNHGGLGGEQTDAFILHPADMVVPPTRNSVDMFAVLNARRERPVQPKRAAAFANPRDDWTPGNLLAGLREEEEWGRLALGSIVLDRSAYRAIATLGSMTGPALFLSLAGALVIVLVDGAFSSVAGFFGRFLSQYGLWLLTVIIMHAVAHVLRGKGTFTKTFRAMGFAQTVTLVQLLRFFPPIDSLVAAAVSLLSLFAAWLAVAEAHQFRGWRTLILPVLYFGVLIVGGMALLNLAESGGLTLETLLRRLGILPLP